MRSYYLLFVISVFAVLSVHAQEPELIRPSQADPSVQSFDAPNVVFAPPASTSDTPLVVFLSGTGGKPQNAMLLMRTVADQGYRVVGLTYDDMPSLSQVCPQNPNPACSANFRQVRTFGNGIGPVQNPPQEAINARLEAILRFLDREHPEAGWRAYLKPDGRPEWSRIAVSGLSQGAGMAAYIAKFYPVFRVVLFSSPWDVTGPAKVPAPWLSRPSATPPDRWWAERHVKENTTELIAHAYRALDIPQDHIFLFNLPLNEKNTSGAENPFHGNTIKNPGYIPEWRQMFGQPHDAQHQ